MTTRMLASRRRALNLIVAAAVAPPAALACDCPRSSAMEVQVAKATVIVIAKLVGGGSRRAERVHGYPSYEPARWQVVHSWKGSLRRDDPFVTVSVDGCFGVGFSGHKEWVLLLPQDPPVRTKVDYCMPVSSLVSAANYVQYLNGQFRNVQWKGRVA